MSERDKAIEEAGNWYREQDYSPAFPLAKILADFYIHYHAKQNAEAGKRDIDITAEDIRKVPSGDPAQWEIELRELCQEIEQLPASEQQTAISVKASAIYQSLGEFNRYCESLSGIGMRAIKAS